jgi:hypothetical protein
MKYDYFLIENFNIILKILINLHNKNFINIIFKYKKSLNRLFIHL